MPRTDPPPGTAHEHRGSARPGTDPRRAASHHTVFHSSCGGPTDLPTALARAFTPDSPGEPRPPGPRANPWRAASAEPVAVPDRERALLDALWHSGGLHRLPDGTPTGIHRRPVPSAGAAYPVQTHIVVGPGADGLAPGRYAYDMEQDTLVKRDDAADRAAGWTSAADRPADGTHLVLTVQPGRSFGRYRHRAWPLWTADTAYALAAVEFLYAPERLAVRLGPGAALRALLGVPPAAEPRRWLARRLAPEIPLAAVALPRSRTIGPRHRDALAARRSPGITEFLESGARGGAAADRTAAASAQAWVRGATRLHTWSIPSGAAAAELAAAVWDAHRAAAAICYADAATGDWRSRPVSGFAAEDGHWTIHALAALPGRRRVATETGP
ncbi:hypothetical protein F4561_003617 [Lipingzhangella halophila]|uniref:Uncharacterized protein n=1 Tax=Lipingzhangella halophila TaxID=1783352 RepID=A0A7W7RJ30_9ACTN|nr:hypothetical protein [Lipingzhangella halophila]MBB4932797.1 hypothetical protein [Lipingzhangella halophila]